MTMNESKCLIIVNHHAGKCKNCSVEKVKKAVGERDYVTCHIPFVKNFDVNEFDEIAVCGGDGTLQIIMQEIYNKDKTVYYFPCGTLNDKAKAEKYVHTTESPHPVTVGKVGDKIFTYVYASGAFTEIGYTTKQDVKQKIGVLAYIFKVIKAYKINRIKAEITTFDNDMENTFSGEFNLIMFIKSPRCFGFHFNRAYDEKDEGGHMVLIRSPKHNGIFGLIEMFFPFFKTFFIGLKNECEEKIVFKHLSSANMELNKNTNFCMDGEKASGQGKISINFEKTKCKLKIIDLDKF